MPRTPNTVARTFQDAKKATLEDALYWVTHVEDTHDIKLKIEVQVASMPGRTPAMALRLRHWLTLEEVGYASFGDTQSASCKTFQGALMHAAIKADRMLMQDRLLRGDADKRAREAMDAASED